MPQVLGALEHSERQAGQEVPGCYQTSSRSKSKSGSPCKKFKLIKLDAEIAKAQDPILLLVRQ